MFPFFLFACLLPGLKHLRVQVLVVIGLAGLVFPPWLTAFVAGEDGGFRWLWSFLLVDTLLLKGNCTHLGDSFWGTESAGSKLCQEIYHQCATFHNVQASIMLLIANLCVVFLYQLGGWARTRVDDDPQKARSHAEAAARACGKRVVRLVMSHREAVCTALAGVALFLPLWPVSRLITGDSAPARHEINATINNIRKDYVSIGMPAVFSGLLPLLCGLYVGWLASSKLLDVYSQLHTHALLSKPTPSNRFTGRNLVVGRPEAAAAGIEQFIRAEGIHDKLKQEKECVVKEWENAFANNHLQKSDMNELRYVLDHRAGSNNEPSPHNGCKRDCHPETGELLPNRKRSDDLGMTLEDIFDAAIAARQAGLTLAHVLALRLYTTSAFKSINEPLRKLAEGSQEAHPLPCTVYLIYDGLKKLRGARRRSVASVRVSSRRVTSPCGTAAFGSMATADVVTSNVDAPADDNEERSEASEDANDGDVVDERVGDLNRPAPLEIDETDKMALMESDALQRSKSLWRRVGTTMNKVRARVRSSSILSPVSSRVGSPTRRAARNLAVLWRGLSNVRATEDFMLHGGSEIAACSTTSDLEIAIRYAKGWTTDHGDHALIFCVIVQDFMQLGPDLSFLSAFPHEKEALYPPLTFFKPTGSKPAQLTYNDITITIVDVRPTFPT